MSPLGVFGGAFDPPHNGHVVLAERAVEHFALDRLVVIVVARPGHREVQADPETRRELAELAFPHDVVLDFRERTIDLLRDRQWPSEAVFLIGADQFSDFLQWKEPDAVLELVRVGVATRPGFPRERLEPVLRRLSRQDRVELFEIEPVDVSSTEVRARVGRGEPIGGLVPPAVAHFIEEQGLYRPHSGVH
jgi:nicotinate-nucleotide adenylyltransferase